MTRETSAALLETLSDTGYSNASAAKDEWQMKWWEQAEYLGGILERLSVELLANAEAIETALYEIRGGRRAMTAPNTTAEDPRIVEPQYHAARLHALIISLRNLDDTPLILADEEQVNIRDWLVAPAYAMPWLQREHRGGLRGARLRWSAAGRKAPVSVPGLFLSSKAKRCRQRRSRQFNFNIHEFARQRRANDANKRTSNDLPVPALRPPSLSPFRLGQPFESKARNLSAARSLPCVHNQDLHPVFAHAPIVAQRLTGRVAGDGCGQNVL